MAASRLPARRPRRISRHPGRRGEQPRPLRRGDDEYRETLVSAQREFFVYANLSAAYAHAGKMDQAKEALAEARRRNPKLTVNRMIEHMANYPAVFDGVRKAGLPEE